MPADRRRRRGGGRLAARRRRLRAAPRASAPSSARPGFERADSLVVNPHKWLFTPVDCSCLFTARPDDLRAAFALTPEYLRTSAEGVTNLNEYGPALGRRFRALKLWAVLRCFGRAGLQATIREHVRLAELFEGWVRDEPGWELCAPRPYSVVCFRPEGEDARSEALIEAVNASGEAYLSHTRLDGRHVLRLAVGNGWTTEADVRLTWDVLQREAARLGAGGRASDARPRAAAHRLRAARASSRTSCSSAGTSSCASSSTRASRCPPGRGTPSSRWAGR